MKNHSYTDMKNFNKILFSMASLFMMSLASCVNEPMGGVETDFQSADDISTIQEQILSIESSVKDLESLQEVLSQQEVGFDGIVKSLENHIAALQGGISQKEGSIATFELQKALAAEMGAIQANLNETDDNKALNNLFNAFEKGVSSWLGERFGAYFPLAVAEIKVSAVAEKYESILSNQKNFVEGVASDLKAGLKEGISAEDIEYVSASVNENINEIRSLATNVASAATEVEEGYRKAIAAAFSNQSGLDEEELEQLNDTAVAMTKSVDNSLANLNSRIEACEEAIDGIKDRLDILEGKVEDLGKLLSMIQSVTYLADYSGDKIFAYYHLDDEAGRDAEGRMKRVPSGDLVVDYLVRPASAAKALAQESLWNNGLNVIGYYADQIQLSSVSPSNYIDFTIKSVTVKDETSGVISITVGNDLKNEFYMKETGAKFALSIQADKTDITSKFVELAPKDISGKVYLESLTLSDQTLSIKKDESSKLTASINPAGAYDKNLTWTASNSNITVDQNGNITANSLGTSVVTVTTGGTDEWGRQLTATCNVTVVTNVRFDGPLVVETGETVKVTLELPNDYYYETIQWSSSNTTLATVDQNGNVTGVSYSLVDGEYTSVVTITCKVDAQSFSHTMKVVTPQPTGINVPGLAYGVNTKEMRVGDIWDITGATILSTRPLQNGVFKISYAADGSGIYAYNDRIITAEKVGSGELILQVTSNQTGALVNGTRIQRNLSIVVLPYYLTGIEITGPTTIEIGGAATLTANLASDTQGKVPTYPDLTWTSSDTDVATVDDNGQVTGIASGAVTITATSRPEATQNGTAISAEYNVRIVEPTADVNVGDYYYNDGTWGNDPTPDGKTVIGVIFSTVSAMSEDPELEKDGKDECYHGLAIGLDQLPSTAYANGDLYASRKTPMNWLINNGYYNHEISKIYGYGNTKGILALPDSDNAFGISVCDGLSKYSTVAPGVSSGWYVPSFREMQMIAEVIDKVNNAITKVSGTSLSSDLYWSSSLRVDWWQGAVDQVYCTPFSISKNTWDSTGGNIDRNSYPVRVVLAF